MNSTSSLVISNDVVRFLKLISLNARHLHVNHGRSLSRFINKSKHRQFSIFSVLNSQLNILHFNDVYNVEPKQSIGGVARLKTAFSQYKSLQPLTLFSGDILSPSVISSATKGHHMVDIMKCLKVDVALYGNHEFDYGLNNFLACKRKTNFPWVISNCFDATTGKPFAEGIEYHIVYHCGLKIGIIGLIEPDWIETIRSLDSKNIIVKDFRSCGNKLSTRLKNVHKCDVVIALTHMRWANDRLLAASVPEVDLILGGHDHSYQHEIINGLHVIKSGTDFNEFSIIGLDVDRKVLHNTEHQRVIIDAKRVAVDNRFQEDVTLKKFIDNTLSQLDFHMDRVIGYIGVPLDGRTTQLRSTETNAGNLIADVMLSAMNADLVILNAGTLRGDAIIPAGPLKTRDLRKLLPIMDPTVLLQTTGKQILLALENAVSQYPKLEGRFPQVAGVRFDFNPDAEAGHRILPNSVYIRDKPLEVDKVYRLCVESYIANGFDGYQVLKDCPRIIDEQRSQLLNVLVENFFTKFSDKGIASVTSTSANIAPKQLIKLTSLHASAERFKLFQNFPRYKQSVSGLNYYFTPHTQLNKFGTYSNAFNNNSMNYNSKYEACSLNKIYPVAAFIEGRIRNIAKNISY